SQNIFVHSGTHEFDPSLRHTHAALRTIPLLVGSYSLRLLRVSNVAHSNVLYTLSLHYALPISYYDFDFASTSNPGEGSISNFLGTSGGPTGALPLNGSDHPLFHDSKGNLQATGTTVLQAATTYSLSLALGAGTSAAWALPIHGA